ncbi:MAG: hypothetical protein II738_03590 [Clostridia bacterium]|nr:hypothetical protein [Clostridia bacterium]
MTNIIVAIMVGVFCVAFMLGHYLADKEAEYVEREAEREARQRRIDNARRFAVIVRQGEEI